MEKEEGLVRNGMTGGIRVIIKLHRKRGDDSSDDSSDVSSSTTSDEEEVVVRKTSIKKASVQQGKLRRIEKADHEN
jgi:hypothetical protein